MSIDETRSQDGIAIIVTDDDAEVIDDISDWERPFTEYGRYGELTGHDHVQCPVCGAEIFDGETSTAPHRPACRCE